MRNVELDIPRFDGMWEPRTDQWFHDRFQLAAESTWVATGNFMRYTKDTSGQPQPWWSGQTHRSGPVAPKDQAYPLPQTVKIEYSPPPPGTSEKLEHLVNDFRHRTMRGGGHLDGRLIT